MNRLGGRWPLVFGCKIVAATVLALALLSCSRHKPPDPHDVYRDVPERDRESLRTAVQQMVQLQVANESEKMYDLLQEPREDKDKFLRRRAQARPLHSFRATSASWIPDGWIVGGCGAWDPRPDQPDALISSLHATKTSDGWRFTPVSVDVFPEAAGHVQTCSP